MFSRRQSLSVALEPSSNSQNQTEPEAPPEQPYDTLPRATISKIISAGLSFLCAGVNDGSLGSLIPYILRSYNIQTNLVSVVYATTLSGWLLTALINTHLCLYLDLGALLVIGAALQLLAQILRTWLLPFPLFTVTFFIQALGMALQDTHSNNFVASVETAHRWLGFVHAMYALGLWVGPFVATGVASAGGLARWNLFYVFLVAIGTVNLALVSFSFRDSLKTRRKASEPVQMASTSSDPASRNRLALSEMKRVVSSPAVWLLSLFYFFFLGAGITASGWVVEYLVVVRHGNVSKMGYVPAGFSGGMFLGRLLLAEPTKRLGERRMVLLYTVLCLGMELLFWLVPNIIAGVVAISIFGFFFGPLFATGVSVGSQIFPASIKSSALAFMFMLGQIGAAIFPAITGVMASRAGVTAMQPMLVGLCSATAIVWLLIPSNPSS